jgi:hypothetical protein
MEVDLYNSGYWYKMNRFQAGIINHVSGRNVQRKKAQSNSLCNIQSVIETAITLAPKEIYYYPGPSPLLPGEILRIPSWRYKTRSA